MESPPNEENIRNLPYSELKKIAKLRGIKCNMKAKKIINALLAGNMGSEEDSFLSLEDQIINSSKKNKIDKFDKDKKETVSETPRRETYTIEDQDAMLNIDAIKKSASPDLDCSNVTMTRGSERKLRNRKVSFLTPLKTSRTSIATPKYLSLKDRPKTPIASRYSEAKRVSFITPNKKQSLTKKSLPSTPHPMHPKKKTRLSEVGASSSERQRTPIVHIPTPIPKLKRGRISSRGSSGRSSLRKSTPNKAFGTESTEKKVLTQRTSTPMCVLKENSILESEMTSVENSISTPQSKFTPKLTSDSIKKTPLGKRKSTPFPNRTLKENSKLVSAKKMPEKEMSEEESFFTPLSKFTPPSSFDSIQKTAMNKRKSTPKPSRALQESAQLDSLKKLHETRKSTPKPSHELQDSFKLDSLKKLREKSSSTPLSKFTPKSSIGSIRKMAFEQNKRLISTKKPAAIVGSEKKASVVANREIATAEKSVLLKSLKKEGSVKSNVVVADENKTVSKGVKRNRSGTPVHNLSRNDESALSSKKKNIATPNFKAIHQKAFDKMESIDEYLKRKTELSAKRTRNNTSVQNKPQPSPVKKVVATKQHKPKTFTGIPFIPSVTHTKNLNLNFGSGTTPKYLQAASKRNLNPAAERKNVHNIRFAAGSKIASVSKENKPNRRSAFDLRASLNKKLPYKPHTGPLKPLNETHLNSTVNSTLLIHKPTGVQNSSVQASRAKCRNMLHGVRTNRRFELQMSKRINEEKINN